MSCAKTNTTRRLVKNTSFFCGIKIRICQEMYKSFGVNCIFSANVCTFLNLKEGITKCWNEHLMNTIIYIINTSLFKHRLHVSTQH